MELTGFALALLIAALAAFIVPVVISTRNAVHQSRDADRFSPRIHLVDTGLGAAATCQESTPRPALYHRGKRVMTPHKEYETSTQVDAKEELERAQQLRYYHIQRRTLAARRRLMLVGTEFALVVLFVVLALTTSMSPWLVAAPSVLLVATLALGRKAAVDGQRNDRALLDYIRSLGGDVGGASDVSADDAPESTIAWHNLDETTLESVEEIEDNQSSGGFFGNLPQIVFEDSDEAVAMPQAPQWAVDANGDFVEMDYREVPAGYGQVIDYSDYREYDADDEFASAEAQVSAAEAAVLEAATATGEVAVVAPVESDYVVGQYSRKTDADNSKQNERNSVDADGPRYSPAQQRWLAAHRKDAAEPVVDRPLTLADQREEARGADFSDSRGRISADVAGWKSTEVPKPVYAMKPAVGRAVYTEELEGQATAAFAKIDSASHVPFRPTTLTGVAEEDIVEPGGDLVFDQVDSILDRRRAANQ